MPCLVSTLVELRGIVVMRFNRKSLSFIKFLILPLLLLAGLAAAGGEEQETFTIGSISILSGEGAAWGTAARNGIAMAVDQINAKGGVLGKKLLVDYQDDQGDPKKTLAAFRELTDVVGVKFIIGPTWSRNGLTLIDAASQKKIVLISPSLGMAKFNESSEFLFNTWPHDYITSEKLAEYVFNKGQRNVALVGAEDAWVKEQAAAFRRRFESLGGKVAFVTEPLPATSDLRTEALKISKIAGIDGFVSTTDGVIVGSLVAKALKELNFNIPMYSVTLDQSAIEAAQGGFEGLEFLTFLTPNEEFKAAYESRFITPIDIGADSAYDAVIMLVDAITKANSTDPTVVAHELAKVKRFPGASGVLVSDGKRGFTKEFALKKVVDGKAVDLKE